MKIIKIFFSFLPILLLFLLVTKEVQASDFGYGSMGGYYTLSEVYNQLDNMYTKYPTLITAKEQIGTTIEGRPIYVVKISDNPSVDEDEPEVFYNALTHAREPMGMEVTLYYMYYLLENYSTDSTAKYLVDNREMWFLPVVNPDGYYYNQTTNPNGGGSWRKNRRNNGGSYGVDLNRNFGPEAYWNYPNTGSSTTPSNATYRGTAPFSEPETQAIRDFLAAHYIKTALNYHTYNGSEIYPYMVNGLETSDETIFRQWAVDMVSVSNYTIGNAMHTLAYNARGSTSDYMYDGDIELNHGKIYSFSPEIGVISFWPPQANIPIETSEHLMPNKYIAFVAGGYTDITSYSVSDEYIDPGEKIELSIAAKNKGLASVEVTTATLTTTSSYVTINDGEENINALDSQSSQNLQNAFSFTVSESIPLGTQMDFILTVKSGDFIISTKNLTYYIATPKLIFSDNCDNMDNWITSSTQTAVWQITSESYHSAPSSCTDSKDENYTHLTNPLNNAITSKTIDLTGYTSPKLSFWTKYEIFSTVDYGKVQISIDDGAIWTSLSGNYTRAGTLVYPISGPLYTGIQDLWKKEEVDLTSYAGRQIKLKFLMSSFNQILGATNPLYLFIERDGWYIDDIKVFEYDSTLSDIIKPKFDWTDANMNNIRFSGSGGNNIYTTDGLPTFTFTKSSDTTAGISGYEILVKPVGKDYYSYITGIPDQVSGTSIDTTERYTSYSGNEVSVFSKRETDNLASGAYKWIVRAIDKNGNSIDSEPKILRINTLSANFSGEWFPLVLLSQTSSPTPSFYGISTVGTKVTVEIVQNGITVRSGEVTVDPTSRFKVHFTDILPPGSYSVNIRAINKSDDYIELPEFKLKISKPPPIITPLPVLNIPTVSTAPSSLPVPTSVSKPEHCFLWWCW